MEYIATYFLHRSVNGGDEIEFLDPKEIIAEDDADAIVKAKSLRSALEAMAEAEPNPFKITRQIILQSVRNQYNKRVVYLRDYGH